MLLQIKSNSKVYLAKVKKENNNFIFILRRKNSLIEHCEEHYFQKFSCSLTCRLRHYKEFKERIFNPEYGRRFISME